MKARVGIVGLGKMALLHASILSAMHDADVVAFCEINSLVRRFSTRIIPDVRVVSDLREFSAMDLDAVYITTPAGSHFPIIKNVYEMAIARHVFVEKPLATNFPLAKEASELAKRHGGANMVGYNRRFSVTFGRAKQILTEGLVGQLECFEAYAYSSDFYGAKANAKASARGGVISDLGCHVADLALWFFGSMDVTGAEVRPLLGGPSEDEATFGVLAGGGLRGEIKTSWCRPEYRMPELGLIVEGANGTLKVDEDKVQLSLGKGQSKTWHKHDLSDEVPFFIGGTDYVREDYSFVRSIADGAGVEPSFETASQVEKLIDDVKKIGKGAR